MKFLMTTAAAAAMAAAFVPAAASAQVSNVQGYGSLGYSYHDFDGANLGAIQGRLGARFGQYMGVEGELGGGVKGDDVNVGGVNIDTKLEHSAAIYGVGFLPVAPNLDLFARVGYGTSKIKASSSGVSASGDDNSWNYGAGGQYFFDDKNGVRADYTRHDFDNGNGEGDANVWSVGYVRKF